MDGLSEVDNYGRENETNVTIWKIKQIIKALQYAKGHGDSLFSLFMDPRKEISKIIEMLDDRFGTTSSINMSATGAIASAQQLLKRYTKVPPNGLIIYTGTIVTNDGTEEKDIRVELEPFKPLDRSLCQLHHRFHVETLCSMLLSQPKYGFIVMADNKALGGMLSGNKKEVLFEFTVKKNYMDLGMIVGLAKDHYIDYIDYNDVSGIVVAVSPTYQTALFDRLDPRLQKKIICKVEVSYGGNFGFDTAISLSSNHLCNVRFIQEISLLTKFMSEIGAGTNTSVFGVEDTLRYFDLGAIKILIVWENLDIHRYVLKNTTSGELTTMHLSKDQETDQSKFLDPGTNAELEVQEKKPLLVWFTEVYKKFGCTLEFVTDSSREGSQFCRCFGGIGAILEYQVDIESFDGDQLDIESFYDHSDGDQLDIESFDDHSDGDQLDIESFYDL